jgi:predicted RNase H-like HicB family nuclease
VGYNTIYLDFVVEVEMGKTRTQVKQTTHVTLSSYRLPLVIEQVEDGSYMATSPSLAGLLVLADTVEEVIQLTPGIAKALIEAMREKGVEPLLTEKPLRFPLNVEVLVV